MLGPLTVSSDESGHFSPLTDFSIEESGPPSPISPRMEFDDEEEIVNDTALAPGLTELQDAPLYRSFGGRGVSKSCDDMLLAALVYRELEKVCPHPNQET